MVVSVWLVQTKEKKNEKKGAKKGDESPATGEGQEGSAGGATARDGRPTEGEKLKDDAAGVGQGTESFVALIKLGSKMCWILLNGDLT